MHNTTRGTAAASTATACNRYVDDTVYADTKQKEVVKAYFGTCSRLPETPMELVDDIETF